MFRKYPVQVNTFIFSFSFRNRIPLFVPQMGKFSLSQQPEDSNITIIIVKIKEYNKKVRLWLQNFSGVQRFVQMYFHLNISINSVFLCPPVETWVWLAVLTVPSVYPRRPSAKTTSLRSRKVSTGWRRGCPSSGTRLWWGLLQFIFYFLLF